MTTEIEKQMQKLKAMGIEINVTPSAANPVGFASRASGLIAQAARDAGIYYEKGDAPRLSPEERAEVTRFGIHDDGQEIGWDDGAHDAYLEGEENN